MIVGDKGKRHLKEGWTCWFHWFARVKDHEVATINSPGATLDWWSICSNRPHTTWVLERKWNPLISKESRLVKYDFHLMNVRDLLWSLSRFLFGLLSIWIHIIRICWHLLWIDYRDYPWGGFGERSLHFRAWHLLWWSSCCYQPNSSRSPALVTVAINAVGPTWRACQTADVWPSTGTWRWLEIPFGHQDFYFPC